MSISSNESFVIVSEESQDVEGNRVTDTMFMYKPLVTFENVLDTYPLELDLLVRVVFEESHREKSSDKIVLVPVGWKNINEAFAVGIKINNTVKFSGTELPQTEQLCHFCYFDDEIKSVLGLSKPFKLCRYETAQLIEFIDRQDYAVLLSATQVGPTRIEDTKDCEGKECETLENNDQQVIQIVTREVIKNISKNWSNEKESLLKEMKELKESVAELQKKVKSDSDSKFSDDESDSDSSDSEDSECTRAKLDQQLQGIKDRIAKMSTSSDSERTLKTDLGESVPTIYGITPTYARVEQEGILIRLSHTLKLVPNFHWIVVEDDDFPIQYVSELLSQSGISYTYLVAPSPESERKWPDDMEYVVQRNAAMSWLRNNTNGKGIVYFLDEYKVYSLEIFNEMRSISKVGVWPVGLAGGLLVEQPIVDSTVGRVVGWHTVYRPDRKFPMDAIGCAINLSLLISHPNAKFSLEVEPALRLSDFLSKLVTISELEPRANMCTETFVWHIRIQPADISGEFKIK